MSWVPLVTCSVLFRMIGIITLYPIEASCHLVTHKVKKNIRALIEAHCACLATNRSLICQHRNWLGGIERSDSVGFQNGNVIWEGACNAIMYCSPGWPILTALFCSYCTKFLSGLLSIYPTLGQHTTALLHHANYLYKTRPLTVCYYWIWLFAI